ncbi:MAG: hypothetical protein ACM3S1_13185 [Hyphomicrobiales bacterium]
MAQPGRARLAYPYPRMTYEEYLASDAPEHSEWVNGEVVSTADVSDRHARLVTWLLRLLGTYAEERGLGTVLQEPFNMKTGRTFPAARRTCSSYARSTRTASGGPISMAPPTSSWR